MANGLICHVVYRGMVMLVCELLDASFSVAACRARHGCAADQYAKCCRDETFSSGRCSCLRLDLYETIPHQMILVFVQIVCYSFRSEPRVSSAL